MLTHYSHILYNLQYFLFKEAALSIFNREYALFKAITVN